MHKFFFSSGFWVVMYNTPGFAVSVAISVFLLGGFE